MKIKLPTHSTIISNIVRHERTENGEFLSSLDLFKIIYKKYNMEFTEDMGFEFSFDTEKDVTLFLLKWA